MTATHSWPALPYESWKDTLATLHLWLQIVGKIQLVQSPWVNHSWHVALQITARGIGTRPLAHGTKTFQIHFDCIDHCVDVRVSDGAQRRLPLQPQSTATFYRNLMVALTELGVPVTINTLPNELPAPIPFERDEVHGAYDTEYVTRYWRVLARSACVFEQFRARFVGKCSPVHYFWGSADLAVTRFSGRTAPEHPGSVPNLPDWVAKEAYSHEVSSAGFWAGNDQYPHAAFYSYAYPKPEHFERAAVSPAAAHYDATLGEFLLPYDEMREADSPDEALLEFLQSTYEAAATLGAWDRAALERPRNFTAIRVREG